MTVNREKMVVSYEIDKEDLDYFKDILLGLGIYDDRIDVDKKLFKKTLNVIIKDVNIELMETIERAMYENKVASYGQTCWF